MGTSEDRKSTLLSYRCDQLLAEKNVIINGISDALMFLDAKTYRIIEVNRAFLKAYQLSQDKVIGHPCHKVTHNLETPCSRFDPKESCPLEGAVRTGGVFHAEHVHQAEDGSDLYFEITAYPVKAPDGQVNRVIHIARDVTARKRAENELKMSTEKIKRFAYSVAHDLKSPAIAVYGVTRLLNEQYGNLLDERGRQHCKHILDGAGEMVELVENINTYISARELTLSARPLSLKEILEAVRLEFVEPMKIRRVKWVGPDTDAVIRVDRVSLVRVLRNLVQNSLKYGGPDLGKVEIVYSQSDRDHVLCVRDDGIGVATEASDRIFDLFERGNHDEKIEGSGMGLAIVREIVEQHGGKVWLEPGNKKGTAFCFSLPKTRGGSTHQEPPQASRVSVGHSEPWKNGFRK